MWRIVRLTSVLAALALPSGLGCVEYGGPTAVKNIPAALTFMISSNSVSSFTPCGCHSGKWGGMPRRATIFKGVDEKVDWPMILVDGGSISQGSTSDMQRLKDMFIFQSYEVLQYDFVSVGFSDLRLGSEELMAIVQEYDLPWSSCNVYAKGVYPEPEVQTPGTPNQPGTSRSDSGEGDPTTSPTQPASADTDAAERPTAGASSGAVADADPVFPPYRVIEPEGAPGYKVGLIGALIQDPGRLRSIEDFSFRPYEDAIREQVDALRSKEKVDLVVLVSDADDLKGASESGVFEGIDIVVAGNLRPTTSPNARINPLNPMYSEAAVRQRLREESEGEEPVKTPETEEVPANPEELEPEAETLPEIELEPLPLPLIIKKGASRGRLVNRLDITLDSSGRIVDYYFEEIRVDDTNEDDPRLAEIARGYDTRVLAVELMDRVKRGYAGSEACESCHPGFLTAWSDHGHFHAYATIEEADKLGEAECTRCHAAGFNDEPRLLTYDLIDEAYQNIGCEGCHPNGQRHITLQNHVASLPPENRANITTTDPISVDITSSTCAHCHKGEWAVNFDVNAEIQAARELCRRAARSGG